VVLPAVALEHERRARHREVDLVPTDVRVELRRGKSGTFEERRHPDLEQAVRRATVQREAVERSAQRSGARAAGPGVALEQRPEHTRCHDPRDDRLLLGCGDATAIDGAEVDESPQQVRATDP
jgi:hypothetical protein